VNSAGEFWASSVIVVPWRRVSSTRRHNWRRVGSLAAARKKLETMGSGSASSLLPFLAGGDLQKYSKGHKQVCFNFVFRSAPLPSPCSNLLLSLQVFFRFLFFCFKWPVA
jgi:hypothetical protein